MSYTRLSGALAVGVMIFCTTAKASVIFNETFNKAAFTGNSNLLSNYSDRWTSASYYFAKNNNGWAFTGNALYLIKTGTKDGALVLNEPYNGIPGAVASRTLTGLTAGQKYHVSFLLSGDNIPGQSYQLLMSVDGVVVQTLSGVDGAPGTNPGTRETSAFIAKSSSAILTLYQNSQTLASPVVDNFSVSGNVLGPSPSAVPEPAAWATLLLGLGAVGAALRMRRKPALAMLR